MCILRVPAHGHNSHLSRVWMCWPSSLGIAFVKQELPTPGWSPTPNTGLWKKKFQQLKPNPHVSLLP